MSSRCLVWEVLLMFTIFDFVSPHAFVGPMEWEDKRCFLAFPYLACCRCFWSFVVESQFDGGIIAAPAYSTKVSLLTGNNLWSIFFVFLAVVLPSAHHSLSPSGRLLPQNIIVLSVFSVPTSFFLYVFVLGYHLCLWSTIPRGRLTDSFETMEEDDFTTAFFALVVGFLARHSSLLLLLLQFVIPLKMVYC